MRTKFLNISKMAALFTFTIIDHLQTIVFHFHSMDVRVLLFHR